MEPFQETFDQRRCSAVMSKRLLLAEELGAQGVSSDAHH